MFDGQAHRVTCLGLGPHTGITLVVMLVLTTTAASALAAAEQGMREQALSPEDDLLAEGRALSPKELVQQANRQRLQQDWASAAATYRELLRVYPESAQARSALVSLADIELDHLGAPAMALSLYESYGTSGVLAAEAALGRIRALRKMGRWQQEKAAIERYLDSYPLSLCCSALRSRLRALASRERSREHRRAPRVDPEG